jgi:hypothetical protein
MAILRDDGVNRHLRFRQPNTNIFMFEIVTWPGYLCYSGDMGCYVFSRIDDMFQFFRADRQHMPLTDGNTLAINPGYWGEKLQAQSMFGDGFKKFSADRLREVVKSSYDDHIADADLSDGDKADLWQEIERQVLANADNGEYAVREAMQDFDHHGFTFSDSWEYRLTDYTWNFIWCCYALAWAIGKYDEKKSEGKPE